MIITGHVFIATSLDGFIARADGALDWLMSSTIEGEDTGYDRFMARMDGLIMGRGTFESVRAFDVWPYDKPVVVLSRTLSAADIPEHLTSRVRLSAESPSAVFHTLEQEGWRHVYVDGGAVIRSCLEANLIQELIVTRVPVLIGAGIPLFGPISQDLRWRHEETMALPSGLVQSRYRIASANSDPKRAPEGHS